MTSGLSTEATAITLAAEGALKGDSGDLKGAIASYEQAVGMAPSVLDLHLILANAQHLDGDTLEARRTLRRAMKVAARPDAANDYSLGKALVELGAGADAVPCFRRVRSEFPGDAAAASALAAALRDAQQPEAAWTEISAAIRMAPSDPVALHTAALIRHDLGDYAGALLWCEKSLQLRPESSGTRVTRGYLRHLLGDASGGWRDFEARPLPRAESAALAWHGESLAGKSILVMGEQGVGDQFQFLRFVQHPILAAADRVMVACQPDAVTLLRKCGFDAVARGTVVETDYYVPLLSLPLVLDVDAEWSISAGSYLSLGESITRVASAPPRVGVVWAGNPAHRNDAVRSIPASLMHSVLQTHPGIRFVCMQHGASRVDVPAAISEFPASGDWLETARQLCTLDLLITVDTGIAHLAGALGLPVWMLIPHVPDWRWGTHDTRTPWYPTMRLFRQPVRGDWSRVLTNLSAALSGAGLGID